MKKINKILSLILILLILTGCSLTSNVESTVTNDKNVSFSYINGFDRELAISVAKFSEIDLSEKSNKEILDWMLNSDNSNTDIENFKNNNFVIEELLEDNLIGYKMTTNLGNIDNLIYNTEEFDISNFQNVGKFNMFTKSENIYTVKFNNNIDDSYNQYISNGLKFESKFVLTLPNKTISNNATSVSEDGLTLTWDLTKVKYVSAEFKLNEDILKKFIDLVKSDIYIAMGVGAAGLIIIILFFMGLSNKKNQKKPLENQKIKSLKKIQVPDLMAPENNSFNEESSISNTPTNNETIKNNNIYTGVAESISTITLPDSNTNEENLTENTNKKESIENTNEESNINLFVNTENINTVSSQEPIVDETINAFEIKPSVTEEKIDNSEDGSINFDN